MIVCDKCKRTLNDVTGRKTYVKFVYRRGSWIEKEADTILLCRDCQKKFYKWIGKEEVEDENS